MSWFGSSKPKNQQSASNPDTPKIKRTLYNQGMQFAKRKGEEVSASMKGMQRRMTNTRAREENGVYKGAIKNVRAILREENINVNRGRRNPNNMEELKLNISNVLNVAKEKLNSIEKRFRAIENSKRSYKPRRNRAAPAFKPPGLSKSVSLNRRNPLQNNATREKFETNKELLQLRAD